MESFRRSASRNAEQRRPSLEHRTPFLGKLHGLTYQHEAAMEALSSLITRQKRGDRTPVAGKFGKLERMSIYLRV